MLDFLAMNLRPLYAVALALTASALIYILGEHVHRNVREAITFAAAVLMAADVYSMIPSVLAGEEIKLEVFRIVKGISFTFNVDPAGMIFAFVASTLWILTSLYSVGYMRGHDEKNQTGYYAAFAMCLCATMGLCFAANLLTFFIFFEILTVATYPLVVHYRDEKGKKSGHKYLAYTLISGQIFFAAIVIIYVFTGTMDFVPGGFVATDTLPMPWACIVFFMMVGAGIVKAGVMPLHSWLPAAMVAPTPVSALLHAVAVVKAGAFCTLRVVLYVFGPEAAKACHGAEILAWMAVATIIVSSMIAIRKNNLKARLAYSTVGQLSYIVLGICILNPFAATGAMYHIIAHAFLKITLFMCAGAIFVTTHKTDITEMVGIGRRMPLTMTAFTLASVGIAGFPFFAGFVSKANIIMGAVEAGKPIYAATFVVSALLALVYLLPVIFIAFRKDVVNPEFAERGEANWRMLVPLLITAVVSIVLGCAPNLGFHLYDIATMAGNSIFGAFTL
ncbi:MAG: monovalent cation/H+ antiporter subunit D family protein [Clostridiales bacterium]|nr:monovalent cation/H+ antiporter subunit D family protein [Candidatus Crickella caballi]